MTRPCRTIPPRREAVYAFCCAMDAHYMDGTTAEELHDRYTGTYLVAQGALMEEAARWMK